MRSKIANNVYLIICNVPIAFFLCLAASINGVTSFYNGVATIDFNLINWMNFLYNLLFAVAIALIVGNVVPLVRIGRWFTALFKVKNDTYKGNMPYRLLASIIISLIYFVAISPTLSLFNWGLGVYQDFPSTCMGFLKNAPLMLIVGYCVSLISDVFAYKAAHKIDPNF